MRLEAIGWPLAGLCLTLGCAETNDRGVELQRVTGVVLRAGEPLVGATVRLTPLDDGATVGGLPLPKARTDASGRFSMRTFEPGDGAPAGHYALTLKLMETVDTGGPLEERDTFDGRYADLSAPPATVVVESSRVAVPPINLE